MSRSGERIRFGDGDHPGTHLDALAALEKALHQPLPAGLQPVLEAAHTALQDAMQQREAAQQRYRMLFNAVPDPVSILSATGTVLDVNAAGILAYGRRREEIIGQPIELLNPDLPEGHLQPVWEALNHGHSYVIEVTNMRGDGSRFPVEVHSAVFQNDGQPCIVAVARDLSRRWQAESRYRLLMDSIDKGVMLFDPHYRVISTNPAAHRIFGLDGHTPARIPFDSDDWIVVDEHGQPLRPAHWPVTRAFAEGRIIPSTIVGLYHRSRGRMIWISITTVPVFSCDRGAPDHVFSLFSDITELKRDHVLFDRAQALAHIGGWEWDRSQQRLYLTGEAQRILDRTPPPATLEQLLQCMGSDDRQRLQQAIDTEIGYGGGFELDLQAHRGDGHNVWVRMIGETEPGDLASSRIAGTLQDITESRYAEETLKTRARTDPLTGIMNRDAALSDLEARLGNPSHARTAVLYIDLDRFKSINDALGHNAGDELLVEATRRIAAAIGTGGLLARFGGDEFVVICDAREVPDYPETLAQAIVDAFVPPFRLGKDDFAISASIGIARAPTDGERPQQLIQNADVAMYECKRRSRNGWQAFTAEMASAQRDRLQIEHRLRRALEREEFRLVYQPQVDLRSGRVVGGEALIRWHNRQLGELRPDIFINHAESTGDIVRIGDWVLHEACRQVRHWMDQGLGLVRVAINVSYRQFGDDNLARQVREVLEEFRLPGAALELEFTERVLIEDAPATLRTLAELREMGVMLSIDDFGEGYSALNYLRHLPIQGLKLSQLLIEGVPGNRPDVAVCEAVCGIARSLGLGLVAEGIESETQRQFLLELGVPIGQGFLFAPGLTPDEFARRLA